MTMITAADQLTNIGTSIKSARKSKGWSQQELSSAAGLRLATISEIENGKANFGIDTLLKISSALELQLCFQPAAA